MTYVLIYKTPSSRQGRPTVSSDDRVSIIVNDVRVTFVPVDPNDRDRRYRTALFGAAEVFAPEQTAAIDAQPRIDAAILGTDESRQTMREYRALVDEVTDLVQSGMYPILKTAEITVLGVHCRHTKWTFSAEAGCSMCACSPGLVADRPIRLDRQVVDIYVERA